MKTLVLFFGWIYLIGVAQAVFYQKVQISEVPSLSSREAVQIEGIALSQVGTISKDFFYLLSLDSHFIPVRIPRGSELAIVPGQRLRVRGRVSQTQAAGTRVFADSIFSQGMAEIPLPVAELDLSQYLFFRDEGSIRSVKRGKLYLEDQDLPIRFPEATSWLGAGDYVRFSAFYSPSLSQALILDPTDIQSEIRSEVASRLSDLSRLPRPDQSDSLGWISVLIFLAGSTFYFLLKSSDES